MFDILNDFFGSDRRIEINRWFNQTLVEGFTIIIILNYWDILFLLLLILLNWVNLFCRPHIYVWLCVVIRH